MLTVARRVLQLPHNFTMQQVNLFFKIAMTVRRLDNVLHFETEVLLNVSEIFFVQTLHSQRLIYKILSCFQL